MLTESGSQLRNGKRLDFIELGLELGRFALDVLTKGITKPPPCLGLLIFMVGTACCGKRKKGSSLRDMGKTTRYKEKQ